MSWGSVNDEVSERDSFLEEDFVFEFFATNLSGTFLVLLPCKIKDWSGGGLLYYIPLFELF